jgi:hypothetical protein
MSLRTTSGGVSPLCVAPAASANPNARFGAKRLALSLCHFFAFSSNDDDDADDIVEVFWGF